MDRRTFLGGAIAAGLAACTSDADSAPSTTGDTTTTGVPTTGSPTTTTVPDPARAPGVPGDPLFRLGVASGDPLPGRVVLWTRLVPEPSDGNGGMPDIDVPVRWQVADDERFRRIVASGTVTTTAAEAHSAHVDVTGLRPGRDYFYRFTTGGQASPTGRTRTAPALDANPRRLRLLFASCQDRRDGFWTAWPHALDEDPDLVMWLGDYIYEGPEGPSSVQPQPGGEVTTLDGYRARWALYKQDPALQAMHAVAPWIATWDDHELENNYARFEPQDAVDAPTFRRRRAAAYRAAWEHLPLRAPAPTGPRLRLYRSSRWGSLADLFMLDGRQYRSDQPCGETTLGDCAARLDPAGTMLGSRQKEWLRRGLSLGRGTWSVIGNQTIMTPLQFGPAYNLDQWDGYASERDDVVEMMRRTRNSVVVTGDFHSAGVGTLGVEGERNRPAGTEFMGTSISSVFEPSLVEVVTDLLEPLPQIEWFDAGRRGYARCDVTPDEWRTDFRVVSTVAEQRATVSTATSWVITAGTPGAERA